MATFNVTNMSLPKLCRTSPDRELLKCSHELAKETVLVPGCKHKLCRDRFTLGANLKWPFEELQFPAPEAAATFMCLTAVCTYFVRRMLTSLLYSVHISNHQTIKKKKKKRAVIVSKEEMTESHNCQTERLI